MGVFDTFIENDNLIINQQWIEFNHSGIPNYPNNLRWFVRVIAVVFGHCLNCTSVSGCQFLEMKSPEYPFHPNCHCEKKQIIAPKPIYSAKAFCNINKIENYALTNKNGKIGVFKALGFDENDAWYLKSFLEREAVNKYTKGEYELGRLDIYGQRITIMIEFNERKFKTGWMVHPLGYIKNTTPFCGWGK